MSGVLAGKICLLYALYKIPLAQAHFLLAHCKIYLYWQALVSLNERLDENIQKFVYFLNNVITS